MKKQRLLSEYDRQLSDVNDLAKSRLSYFQEQLDKAKTDKDRNYYTERISECKTVETWTHWHLMIINPD